MQKDCYLPFLCWQETTTVLRKSKEFTYLLLQYKPGHTAKNFRNGVSLLSRRFMSPVTWPRGWGCSVQGESRDSLSLVPRPRPLLARWGLGTGLGFTWSCPQTPNFSRAPCGLDKAAGRARKIWCLGTRLGFTLPNSDSGCECTRNM